MSLRTRLNLNAVALLILFVMVSGGGGIIGEAASFTSDDKPAVVVLNDSTAVGSVPNWVNGTDVTAIRGYVESKGGEFRLLDPDKQAADVASLGEKWKQAIAVKHASLPWIAGAYKGRGFSEALPVKREDAFSHLSKIGGGL